MGNRKIGGLWVVCDDLEIADSLLTDGSTASLHLNKECLSQNSSILSLISTDSKEFNFLSVATSGKTSSDFEKKITFGPSIQLERPLKIEDVLESLPKRYRKHILTPTRRASTIPPASWKQLLERIIKLSEIGVDKIDHLNKIIASREMMKQVPLPEVIKYEHDAVAVSLEIFQGSKTRQQYLSNSPIDSRAPFIQSLEESGANVLEDHMIDNDLSSFPGVEIMRRNLIGAVEIKSESGKLTLLNSNRTKVENTLGVDLIYYHHTYKSFTLVQYKRLTGSTEAIYRPNSDRSYGKEIARMREFLKNTPKENSDNLQDYRLSNIPFLFKFCNSRPKDHWNRMTPGMYIPLELWEKFILSEKAKGSRGGLSIGYENAQRWLNNSEFIGLVRKGWIGSQGMMTDNINKIIKSELSANKSIIYAVHQKRNSRDDLLRDTHGRFASEEDIDAM